MFEDVKPHIKELRNRLIIIFVSILVFFLISFTYWEILLTFMIEPLKAVLPEGSSIVFTKVQEPFFTALKVSFFAGFILAFPIVLWQIWSFIAPALYKNEKKVTIQIVASATIMFLIGVSFAYYIVVPLGFEFLINFGSKLFTALPSISEYVGFFTRLLIGFGIAFELPVISMFLAKIGLITERSLIGFFKYAIIIIFILSAMLTPPDVVTQLLMAGPMVILYGISIVIVKMINPYEKEVTDTEQENKEK